MKVNRAELLREIVEDAEGYNGKDEWREKRKQRTLKPLKESKEPKGKDKRRAWKLAREIRRGEYNISGTDTKQSQKTNEESYYDSLEEVLELRRKRKIL